MFCSRVSHKRGRPPGWELLGILIVNILLIYYYFPIEHGYTAVIATFCIVNLSNYALLQLGYRYVDIVVKTEYTCFIYK